MDEFLGRKNVSILEFVNPSDFHFLAVQLEDLDAVGEGDWIGGDSWFDGWFFTITLFLIIFSEVKGTIDNQITVKLTHILQ